MPPGSSLGGSYGMVFATRWVSFRNFNLYHGKRSFHFLEVLPKPRFSREISSPWMGGPRFLWDMFLICQGSLLVCGIFWPPSLDRRRIFTELGMFSCFVFVLRHNQNVQSTWHWWSKNSNGGLPKSVVLALRYRQFKFPTRGRMFLLCPGRWSLICQQFSQPCGNWCVITTSHKTHPNEICGLVLVLFILLDPVIRDV